jgi:hypothetical protein
MLKIDMRMPDQTMNDVFKVHMQMAVCHDGDTKRSCVPALRVVN